MPQPLVHIKHPDIQSDDPGIVSRRHFDAHLKAKGWQIVSPTSGEVILDAEAIGKLTGPKADALIEREGLTVPDDAKVADKQQALLVHYGYAEPDPAEAGEGTVAGTGGTPPTTNPGS